MKNKLRLIKLIKDETMQDMADKLNIPRIILDSIEENKTLGNLELLNRILIAYDLNHEILDSLENAIEEKKDIYNL